MLIDCSYFTKGSRHILNASLGTLESLPRSNTIEVNHAIMGYVEEYQQLYLINMLGDNLGSRIDDYLMHLDEEEDPVQDPDMDVICERLRESFADYVFFHILRDMNTQSTMTGLVRLKCANEYVAPISRQVSVWNSMVNKNRLFRDWCDSKDCNVSGISTASEMLTYINNLNL